MTEKASLLSFENRFTSKTRKKAGRTVAAFSILSLTASVPTSHYNEQRESLPITESSSVSFAQEKPVTISEKVIYTKKRCGNSGEKVLLTFDDWTYKPTRSETKKRLKKFVFALHGERTNSLPDHSPVGAVFFPVNQFVQQDWPRAPRYLRQNGMYVGNHSWSHKQLTDPETNLQQEILGGVKSNLLRPPYGSYNRRVERFSGNHGYKICTWTLDTEDWTGISARKIRRKVRKNVEAGDVILMHLQPTSHALEAIQRGLIEDIEKKGLEVCAKPKEKASRNIPNPIPECD